MTTATLEAPKTEKALVLGIHSNVSFTDYQAIDAVNNSTLKDWAYTAAEAREAGLHPRQPSAAFRTGDACHVAVLEPKRFQREFARAPKFDLRTIKGKAAKAQWEESHPDLVSLSREEYDMACGMRDSVWSHPLASELLKGQGQNEVTVIWIDPETGLLCKARLDRLTPWRGWSVVIDLKTCKQHEASVELFPKVIGQFHYQQQAAFYGDGLNVLAPYDRRFVFLAVEKVPPYLVACHELDDSDIIEGRARYRAALTKLAEAKRTGEYPGYPCGIEGVTIPAYFYEYTRPPR